MEIDKKTLSDYQLNEEIERLFQEVIFNPENFKNHIDICLLHIQKNDFSSASKYFFSLINNVPSLSTIRRILKSGDYKEIFLNMSFTTNETDFILMRAFFLYLFGFKEEAKNLINSLKKENCLYDGFYFVLLKYLLFDEDNFEKGEEFISYLLDVKKSRKLVYILAALFYHDYNDFNRSLYFFSLAIKNNPDCQDYFLNRGILFYDKKKYKVAIKDLKSCIKINESNEQAYIVLGKAMFESKQYLFEDCVSVIEKGSLIDPDNPFFYQALYDIYRENGEYTMKCIELTSELIRISPDNDHFYFERSKWWMYPFQLRNAISDVEKAISINSIEYDYFKTLSFLLNEVKDYRGSNDALQKCLLIRPTYSHLNLKIAKNHFFLLDFENVVIFMKKEKVLDWDVEDFYILGYSLFKLERFEESIFYYSKGIEILDSPDDDFVLYNLLFAWRGYSYKMLGEISKSGKDLTRSGWACDMFFDYDPSDKIEKRFPKELRSFS